MAECKLCGKTVRQRSRIDRELPRDTCKRCLKVKRRIVKEAKQTSLDHGHRLSSVWRWTCPSCKKKKITFCEAKKTCITCCVNGGYDGEIERGSVGDTRVTEVVEADSGEDVSLRGRSEEIGGGIGKAE